MVSLKVLKSPAWIPGGNQWWLVFLSDQYWNQSCLTSLLALWTVGWSVTLASLWTTPSWVLWLIWRREGMPEESPRVTLTDLRSARSTSKTQYRCSTVQQATQVINIIAKTEQRPCIQHPSYLRLKNIYTFVDTIIDGISRKQTFYKVI